MTERKATLRGRLMRRVERWLARKERTPETTATLDRRRVFILPTRAGLVFAAVLLAMFVGATNYANSLAFLLTFLLAPVGALGMWHTQRNLLNLRIVAMGADPVFAGQQADFRIRIENHSQRQRNTIGLRVANAPAVFTSLAPAESAILSIPFSTVARGVLRPGRVTVFTQYPLGLFEAWSWASLALEALVYPRPEGSRELPPGRVADGAPLASQKDGHEDFGQLRDYSPGDSPRHIAWKASARGDDLLTKRFVGVAGQAQTLDWSDTPGPDPERKLSQLALWILRSDDAGARYALSLPGAFVGADSGRSHRLRCLRSLALWHPPE